jgi:hypothetical protein
MAQIALLSGQDNSKDKTEKLTGKQLFLMSKAGEEVIEEGDQGIDALDLKLQKTILHDNDEDDDDDDDDYIPSGDDDNDNDDDDNDDDDDDEDYEDEDEN